MGSWTAWGGIALIAGPLAGGWIVDHASWRWIFALNVPLVVATLVLINIAVRGSAGAHRRPIDLVGACLCAIALAGLVFGLVEESRHGWASAAIVAPLAGGAAALALFVGYERRVRQPMLTLGLFSRRNFAIANMETFAMYAGVAILFFFLVIYLQQVAGYWALKSGLTTLPETAVMFALSRRAGALADRFGPRLFMGAGPLLSAAGILLLARLERHVSFLTDLLPALLVFAIGLSFTLAPLTATVLAEADESDAGIASAVNKVIRVIVTPVLAAGADDTVLRSQRRGAVAVLRRRAHEPLRRADRRHADRTHRGGSMNLTDESQAILQRRIDIGRAAMASTWDEGDLETAATDAISDILTAVVGPYGYTVAGQLRPDPTSLAEAWALIDRAISSWVGDAEDYYVAPISDERAAARKRLEEAQVVNDAAEADTIGDWW